MQTVQLTTYDGVRLAANLFVPADPGTWRRGMIVCHGFGSNKEAHTEFGELAASRGFATLIPDLRGHGASEGEVDANIYNDVAAAQSYMQEREDVDPTHIAIRGSSFGGWLAIHTASHLVDLSPTIAFCPVSELYLMSVAEELAMVKRGHPSPRLGSLAENPPRIDVNATMALLQRSNVAKAAAHIAPRRLLLVHCEGDEVVPLHISEQIYAEAQEPKTLWILPGGSHGFAQHDPATNSRTLDWVTSETTGPLF